jgi:hypothetical protein
VSPSSVVIHDVVACCVCVCIYIHTMGRAVGQSVEALCYKLEDHGFDS